MGKSDHIEMQSGMEIEVQFVEQSSDGNSRKYTLNGKIVRYVAMGNDRELVGCKLSGRHPELEKMIYEKQRQTMTTSHKPQVKRGTTKELARDLAALSAQDPKES